MANTKQINGQVEQGKAAKLKLFMTWVKGDSRDDFEFILNFESLRSHLKVYNHELKEVVSAPLDTPWHVVWMLVRYSRKHIWCPKKELDLKPFHQSVWSVGNKMRWRWFFSDMKNKEPFLFGCLMLELRHVGW
jgi:hypothetical protein